MSLECLFHLSIALLIVDKIRANQQENDVSSVKPVTDLLRPFVSWENQSTMPGEAPIEVFQCGQMLIKLFAKSFILFSITIE
jgi:hypothetical protein